MKLLWRSGRRRGKADGKEKEKDIRESRKPWSGITAQKVSIVAVLFLVMYALGALTAKKAESVGVSALLHEKSENWGLGFGTEGKPPTGNASAEELKKYNAYFIGDTTQNTIYLTFDCGYENGNTEPILDALKKHDVKATFFVVGNFLETSPEIVKRMIAEGHTVGNHTYHHVELIKVSENEARLELADTSAVIVRITGKEPEYMRPPFGTWQRKLEQDIQMLPVLWTIDPLDWTTENQDEIVNKVVTEAEENDIILLHDCYKSSVEAGLRIVDILQEEGFVFVTVDELLLN